jgi:hypothetical protein
MLLALSSASGVFGAAFLYDNTALDTGNALLYSVGPYSGIGDQIRLASNGRADYAQLQFFNAGAAGSFDVQLRFYEVGAPVGALIGSAFTLNDVQSTGSDVIDVSFYLQGLALPQDLVFVATINADAGMDLGINLFEPPVVGLSDNTFMIVDTGSSFQAFSSYENVYFQITAIPEPSTLALTGAALAACAVLRRRRVCTRQVYPGRNASILP